MSNAIFVQQFIDQVWNHQAFGKLDYFLHPDYRDYSLPDMLPSGKEGTQKWIISTGASFEHHTVIEDQITEGDKSVVRISMHLKHISTWRNIEPTGIDLQVAGFRLFTFKDNKIAEHRALIDGQAIETLLKKASHGCKTAK